MTPTPTVIEEATRLAEQIRRGIGGKYDREVERAIPAFIAAIELGERRAEAAAVGWLRTLDKDEWYPHSVAECIERGDHRSKPA